MDVFYYVAKGDNTVVKKYNDTHSWKIGKLFGDIFMVLEYDGSQYGIYISSVYEDGVLSIGSYTFDEFDEFLIEYNEFVDVAKRDVRRNTNIIIYEAKKMFKYKFVSILSFVLSVSLFHSLYDSIIINIILVIIWWLLIFDIFLYIDKKITEYFKPNELTMWDK